MLLTSFIPLVCEEVETIVELPKPLGAKLAPFPVGPGLDVKNKTLIEGNGDKIFGKGFNGLFKTGGANPRYFVAFDYPRNEEAPPEPVKRVTLTRKTLDETLAEKKRKIMGMTLPF